MDKIEQMIRLHMEMDQLKRKIEGNVSECFLEFDGCTSTNKTMNNALLLI